MHENDRRQGLNGLGTMDIEDPAGIAVVIRDISSHLPARDGRLVTVRKPRAT
jgi:hypothetical protein